MFGSTTVRSRGQTDIFVAKYSPTGEVLWVRSGGGSGDDESHGIAVYPDGSSIVAGSFERTAEFGSGPDRVSVTSESGKDVFLVKYDTNGDIVW